MSDASIAVVIPMLNGEPWILQTLVSVMKQSLLPREIVVVDNGSVDASKEIARSFSGVTLYQQLRKGTHYARQLGLEKSLSEFVLFLDQDDILHPQHLEILSSLLQVYPDACAALSRTITFHTDEDLHFSRPFVKPEIFDPWETFPFHRIDSPSLVLIRRNALEAIGGWPTANGWSSDVDAWFKLSSMSPMIRNRSVTAAYRTNHKTATSYQWRHAMAYRYFSNVRKTCEAVAQDRVNTFPMERDKRFRQCQILYPMASFIQAFESFDSLLAHTALTQLEQILSLFTTAERMSAKGLIVDTLSWYVRPTMDSGEAHQLGAFVATLNKRRPSKLKSAGKLLVIRLMSETSTSQLFSFLLADPFDLSGWGALLRYRAAPKIFTFLKRLKRLHSRWQSSLKECKRQTEIDMNEMPVP
jgi:glycosyltransferase involved in cell wall biosynthesis